jgi:hypothetical protein
MIRQIIQVELNLEVPIPDDVLLAELEFGISSENLVMAKTISTKEIDEIDEE